MANVQVQVQVSSTLEHLSSRTPRLDLNIIYSIALYSTTSSDRTWATTSPSESGST